MSLLPDRPERFRAELRDHSGPPGDRTLDCDHPVRLPDHGEARRGGAVLSLRSLSLFPRTLIREDDTDDLVQTVPGRLARRSATEGFYAQKRAAHLGGPGKPPVVKEGAGP